MATTEKKVNVRSTAESNYHVLNSLTPLHLHPPLFYPPIILFSEDLFEQRLLSPQEGPSLEILLTSRENDPIQGFFFYYFLIFHHGRLKSNFNGTLIYISFLVKKNILSIDKFNSSKMFFSVSRAICV